MRVLLTGASGFVGGAILRCLLSEGHRVVAVSRDSSRLPTVDGLDVLEFEFAEALHVGDWLPLLEGVHAVVNSVGIIRETRQSRFEELHARAPLALFRAAKQRSVRRIVQISAHGVKKGSRFEYQSSKAQADDFLLEECGDRVCILRPSLIFGETGETTRMFRKLAALPVIPLVGTGEYRFRPIRVEDVARLTEAALSRDPMPRGVYDVGGDDVMSLRQLLLALRASSEGVRDLSHPAWEDGPTVKVPLAMMKLLARTSDFAKLGPMDSDMLGMLVESADFEIGGLLDGFGFRPLGLRSALLDARG